MSTEKVYVKNGPLLELVDGHFPSIMNIKGLDFDIAIVMSANDLTAMDGINRQLQAERLVQAWNRLDPLTDELAAARALLKELLEDGQAFTSAIELHCLDGAAWAERTRAFLKGGAA